MPLILDTCAAIWIVSGARLDPEAEDAIKRARRAGEVIYVSAITAWEVGLLAMKGRFASPLPPGRRLACMLHQCRLSELTPAVLIDSSFLPGRPPRDPSDRIIIATAREHDLTVVTRDRLILDYAGAGNVRALAC